MGQPEWERQKWTGRNGNTDRYRQNRNDRTGQAEQERKNVTSRTGKAEQASRQNRIDRIGQAEEDFLLYRFEDSMFYDCLVTYIYCFETVLLCDMYRLRTYRFMTYTVMSGIRCGTYH
jgi:hypothetical protein